MTVLVDPPSPELGDVRANVPPYDREAAPSRRQSDEAAPHPLPPSQVPAGYLRTRFFEAGSVAVLQIAGDLSAGSHLALDAQIDQIATVSSRQVVVELSGLRTIDDLGVNALSSLHHYLRGRGISLRLRGAMGSVAKALRSVGL